MSSEKDPQADADTEEIDIFDEEADQSEQIFDFVKVPSFISLISGNSVELLYFVKLASKGVAEKDILDHLDTLSVKVNVIFRVIIYSCVAQRISR